MDPVVPAQSSSCTVGSGAGAGEITPTSWVVWPACASGAAATALPSTALAASVSINARMISPFLVALPGLIVGASDFS
ncbi:hypothetical protein BH11ACT7_BH11ACT7_33220 [soil metagenome]